MPTNIDFKAIAGKIKLMPIKALCWYVDTDTFLNIANIEKESSIKLTPKIRTTSEGKERVLGYNIDGTFYIPYNDFKNTSHSSNIIYQLDALINKDTDLEIVFGSSTLSGGSSVSSINTNGGFKMDFNRHTSMSYEIEQIELRPRIKISVKGFVKEIKYSILNIS